MKIFNKVQSVIILTCNAHPLSFDAKFHPARPGELVDDCSVRGI